MTESEKPLHVRVAEALGWTNIDLRGYIHDHGGGWQEDRREWAGRDPVRQDASTLTSDIPHFDAAWGATGPLIERYGLDVGTEPGVGWSASVCEVGRDFDVAYGPTPLVAVCNLVLVLHVQGRLTPRATPQDELRQEGGK